MRRCCLLILLASVAWSTTPAAGEPRDQTLRIDVTDSRREITQAIDATLTLRIVRVPHERAPHFGWEIQVVDRPTRGRGTNLLRPQTFSGGPHPSDVLAWLSRDRHFPDDRVLIVPGQPYEIRIRLIDCRTEQIGDAVSFVSGHVEISWRRLDLAALPPFSPSQAGVR
ncbi:MAG TPA: hypothetical protein VFN94_01780 [Nitrospiria bacterium]|nr:hypothetical protein [Nitrospiria bacterium]